MATNKYICKVCGYIHNGEAAPDMCPVCKVPASEFEMEKPKGGLFSDKNGNAYIITYATVMVVLVASVLAFVAMSLKDLQNENVLNEKKNAILTALSAEEGVSYDSYISAFAVDTKGQTISSIDGAAVISLLDDLSASFAAGTLPVFQATDGRVVIPVSGTGLWGAIWGYVALESDMNTISGIVIDHASETPGLGAEVATAKHQAMYVGKKLFEGGEFVSVKLVKGGASTSGAAASHEVDAITGGTKTSDGVSAMLFDSLEGYVPFFSVNGNNK
ncbi:MAG: Na(+)-translocating NADH:ubiquinone reductase subunit C [Rikenellaceae bacterium]